MLRKIVLSSMIGNALEWYEFVVYSYFAPIIGKLFFPEADNFSRLLLTFCIFAAGFLARPIGAILFGHLGDKKSRKEALLYSIYIMAIPTALMGCLPGYQTIGIMAPILLTLCRILQGISIGGEFTGAIVLTVEHAPNKARGFIGSWSAFSLIAGIILGSLVSFILNASLSTQNLESWGWRLPFLFSIVGSAIGAYMRRNLTDAKNYKETEQENLTIKKKPTTPLAQLFSQHSSKMILVIFIDFLTAIGFFILTTFMPNYFQNYLKISASSAMFIHTINMCIFAIFTVIGGTLSDKIGRKAMMQYPALAFVLFAYPVFSLMQSGNLFLIAISQLILVIFMGLFFGTIPSSLVEIFPGHIRFSGLSLSHNISMAIFGGTAPLMAFQGIKLTNNLCFPAILLMISALLTLAGLAFFKNYPQEDLN